MKKFTEISAKWIAEAQDFLNSLDADYRSSRAQLDADYQNSRAEVVQWLEEHQLGGKVSVPISLAPSAPKILVPATHSRKMMPIDAITESAPLLEKFSFMELLEFIQARYGAEDFPKESVRGAFRRWIGRGDCPFVKLPKLDTKDAAELNRYGKRPHNIELGLDGENRAGNGAVVSATAVRQRTREPHHTN